MTTLIEWLHERKIRKERAKEHLQIISALDRFVHQFKHRPNVMLSNPGCEARIWFVGGLVIHFRAKKHRHEYAMYDANGQALVGWVDLSKGNDATCKQKAFVSKRVTELTLSLKLRRFRPAKKPSFLM